MAGATSPNRIDTEKQAFWNRWSFAWGSTTASSSHPVLIL
jgi:hypothetical protein